jgi:hypothetical protein
MMGVSWTIGVGFMAGNDNGSTRRGVDASTLGRVTSLLLGFLLLVKVYGVAGFSLTTATALLTAAPLSVLVGVIALYQYAFMALVAAGSLLLSIAWFWFLYPERYPRPRRRLADSLRVAMRRSMGFIKAVIAGFVDLMRSPRTSLRRYLNAARRSMGFIKAVIAGFVDFKRSPRTSLERYLNAARRSMGFVLTRCLNALRGRGELRRWVPFTLVLTLFSAALTPLFYLRWSVISIPVVLLIYFVARRKVSLPMLTAYLAAFVVAGSILLTISRPWLPAEVVNFKDSVVVNPQTGEMSQNPIVFVVSQGNGWTSMLVNYDRYLLVVRDSTILQRRICHLAGQLGSGQTLYQRIRGEPYYSPNLDCTRIGSP